MVFGVPLEFILFGATLVGVALFHRHTLYVAIAYVIGFSVMLALVGWNPHEPRKASAASAPVSEQH